MRKHPIQTEVDRSQEAHIAAKLANFGDMAGLHGSLEACQVKLPPLRVDRSTNLRLIELSRQIGFKGKTTPVRLIMLNALARIPAGDFYATIADLHKRGA